MSSTGQQSSASAVVAFLVGAMVGLAAGYPALPAFGGFEAGYQGGSPGPVGSVLLVGALAVLLIAIMIAVLYQLYAWRDR